MIISMLLWIPSMTGFGVAMRTWAYPDPEDPGLETALDDALLGLLVLAGLAFALHLFFALGGFLSLLGLVAGWLGLWIFRKKIFPWSALEIAGSGVLFLSSVYLAYVAQANYDTGLYHLQTLRWDWAERAVLGLANLQSRFGFNSSWHILSAFLAVPGLVLPASFSANAILSYLGLSTFFAKAVCRPKQSLIPAVRIMALGLLVIFVILEDRFFWDTVSSPSTDLPAALLTVLCLLELAEAAAGSSAATFHGLCLASLAVTVKLSCTPLLMASVLLFFAKDPVSRYWKGILLVALFWATWLAHGIILSGCLLYPIPSTRLPFLPWTAPVDQLLLVEAGIRSYARIQGSDARALVGWAWIPVWLNQICDYWLSPLLAWALATGLVTVLYVKIRGWHGSLGAPFFIPWLVSGAGLAFWFLSAPDPRFGWGFLLFFAIYPLAWSLGRMAEWPSKDWYALASWILLIWLAWEGIQLRQRRHYHVMISDWPRIPVSSVTEINGIWIPSATDQCWDAALPCSPERWPDLVSLTDPGQNLAREFMMQASKQTPGIQ